MPTRLRIVVTRIESTVAFQFKQINKGLYDEHQPSVAQYVTTSTNVA